LLVVGLKDSNSPNKKLKLLCVEIQRFIQGFCFLDRFFYFFGQVLQDGQELLGGGAACFDFDRIFIFWTGFTGWTGFIRRRSRLFSSCKSCPKTTKLVSRKLNA
jgi:hypothetical protein